MLMSRVVVIEILKKEGRKASTRIYVLEEQGELNRKPKR
jgi:hypothetical protein